MKEATSTDSISRKASKQARMRGEPRFLPSFLFPFPSLDLAWYTTFVINERISREVNLTPLRSPILPSPTNARAPTPVAEKLAWVATPLPPSLPPSLPRKLSQAGEEGESEGSAIPSAQKSSLVWGSSFHRIVGGGGGVRGRVGAFPPVLPSPSWPVCLARPLDPSTPSSPHYYPMIALSFDQASFTGMNCHMTAREDPMMAIHTTDTAEGTLTRNSPK